VRKEVKNPVLTSPWKIGVLVALLLLITNVGVGYYIISQYNVDLEWLKAGNFWEIDSFLFFKEMFPLAAGILLCSLFSYFVIASAVRRYRYYVDSGQDYRKMVSLADSIDDLTNPAQIARLSDFPELQEILRNYGDQIKDISDEINSREAELAPSELEAEVESLLKGEPVLQAEESNGKWWAELVRKLQRHYSEKNEVIEELYKSNDRERRKTAGITLSMGRILESAGEARNRIREIAVLLSDIEGVPASSGASGSAQEDPDARTALSNVGSLLKKLEQGGGAMRQFSERTNGLALNIALLAARGEVEESDLANYAEKARETAEKFSKLANAVSGITAELSANYQVMSGGLSGRGGLRDAEAASEAGASMIKLRQSIEAGLNDVGNYISNLESDLKSLNSNLRSTGDEEDINTEGGDHSGAREAEEPQAAEVGPGTEADGAERDDGGKLVINHGKAWEEDYAAEKRMKEVSGSGLDEISLDGIGEGQDEEAGDIDGLQPKAAAEEPVAMEDERNGLETAESGLKDPAAAEAGLNEPAADQAGEPESWDSLNVSEPDEAAESSDVKVEFREEGIDPVSENRPEPEEEQAAGKTPDAVNETVNDGMESQNQEVSEGPGLEVAYQKHLDQSVREQDQRSGAGPEAAESDRRPVNEDEDDPIIDLFDLGAVELDKAESPR